MAASVRTEPTPLPTTGDPFRDLQRDIENRESALAVASVWADPDPPTDDVPEEPAPEQDDEKLPPTDVLLSDGRIVRLHRTRGSHDFNMGRLFSQWGVSAARQGSDVFAECKTVMSIESIRQQGQSAVDARPFRTPETLERLRYQLGQFYTIDLLKLMTRFAALNMGLVPDGAAGDGDGRDDPLLSP